MSDDDLILVRRGDLLAVFNRKEGQAALDGVNRVVAAVNAPVYPVVPLTRLREWIDGQRNHTRDEDALDALAALLDEYEGTTDGD